MAVAGWENVMTNFGGYYRIKVLENWKVTCSEKSAYEKIKFISDVNVPVLNGDRFFAKE